MSAGSRRQSVAVRVGEPHHVDVNVSISSALRHRSSPSVAARPIPTDTAHARAAALVGRARARAVDEFARYRRGGGARRLDQLGEAALLDLPETADGAVHRRFRGALTGRRADHAVSEHVPGRDQGVEAALLVAPAVASCRAAGQTSGGEAGAG